MIVKDEGVPASTFQSIHFRDEKRQSQKPGCIIHDRWDGCRSQVSLPIHLPFPTSSCICVLPHQLQLNHPKH